MVALDALNIPLPASPLDDVVDAGEGSLNAGVAGQAGMDIVTAITTIM